MVRQCCVCGKVKEGDQWVVTGSVELKSVEVTHGYCETCYESFLTSVTEFADARNRLAAVNAA